MSLVCKRLDIATEECKKLDTYVGEVYTQWRCKLFWL